MTTFLWTTQLATKGVKRRRQLTYIGRK